MNHREVIIFGPTVHLRDATHILSNGIDRTRSFLLAASCLVSGSLLVVLISPPRGLSRLGSPLTALDLMSLEATKGASNRVSLSRHFGAQVFAWPRRGKWPCVFVLCATRECKRVFCLYACGSTFFQCHRDIISTRHVIF